MTVEKTEPRSGPFAAMRHHYRVTRHDHRPVPVVVPLASVTILALAAYFLLDARAAALHDNWPVWIEKPAELLTDLAKSGWIITVAAGMVIAGVLLRTLSTNAGLRRLATHAVGMASYVLLSVAISGLIANIFKRAIGRPRPELFDNYGLLSFNPFKNSAIYESFPSGHATTAGAFWTALALLFPPLRWPFLLFGLYVAMTRVFVGAHFPSDVAVGFGWGMWFAFFLAVVFARHGVVFSHKDGRLAALT